MKLKWFVKDKTPKTPTIPPKARAVMEVWRDPEQLKTDPNGSYTGMIESPYSVPVQDADDL